MTTKSSKKEMPWGKSSVKDLLKSNLETGKIPDSMSVKNAKELQSEYKDMTIELFCSCLYALKKQLKTSKQQATNDKQHLAHYRLLYPMPTHNEDGSPVWVGSAAKRLLKIDIDNGLYVPGSIRPLHESQN